MLLIISDDQAWMDLRFMGHGVVQTPHLNRFAAESAVFPNGYVHTSLCRASLATLPTGSYGHQHNTCTNDPPEGIDRNRMLPPNQLGLVKELRAERDEWWRVDRK